MKKKLDPATLLQYSGQHLHYEIIMLWRTADALRNHAKHTTEYSALLESFATHLRNLIEFLFDKSSGKYVRAKDFFANPAHWNATRSAGWNRLHERACNEVNHLGKDREDNPSARVWPISDILKQIEPILKDFAAKADHRRLNAKIRKLFGQPPAPAASPTATVYVSTTINASTTTPTVSYVIVGDKIKQE